MKYHLLKKFFYSIFTFSFLFTSLYSSEACNEYMILRSRGVGMFSVFNDVLLLLDCYEKGKFGGIEVNFEKSGLYYDASKGPNWWEYYCEPICIGDKKKMKVLTSIGTNMPYAISRVALRAYDRHKAYALINKYIHIKPNIQKSVKKFVDKNFASDFVIGVHYRGTDKISEAPRESYDVVAKSIASELEALPKGTTYTIFVATDEAAFLEFMLQQFSDAIVYYETARSINGQPIHVKPLESRYDAGKGAIIDCLLLSKTNLIIRTSSNLSLWSGYFNPDVRIISLTERYHP